MGRPDDDLQLVLVLPHRGVEVAENALGKTLDRLDRLVELVGDTRAQLTQSRQLRRLDQLGLSRQRDSPTRGGIPAAASSSDER